MYFLASVYCGIFAEAIFLITKSISKKMEKREQDVRTLRQEWEQLWGALESANTAFNEFLQGGLSVSDGQRVKQFVSKWDKLKNQAEQYYDSLDRLTNQQTEPVEVELPWATDTFKEAWEFWKDYLKEQHHIYLKSRMEKKSLAQLKKVSEDHEQKAVEYLDYAEAGGYRKFFKVTEKELKESRSERRNDDGDF